MHPGPGRHKSDTAHRFKAEMARRASREKTLKRMDSALEAEDHKEFLSAFRECADRGYGKPTETIEHSSPDGSMTPQVWVFGAKPVKF